MLTILSVLLVAIIALLGWQLLTPQPKMQPLKIKIEKETRDHAKQRRR